MKNPVSSPPKYSILIPSFRSLRFLKDCLDSVLNLTGPGFEVLFLDNGSPEPEADWVENNIKDPRFHVFRLQATRFFTGGVNFLAERAQGEFIVLLNSDTRVEPDWLQIMDARLQVTGYEAVISDVREVSHPEEPGNKGPRLDPFGLIHHTPVPIEEPGPAFMVGGCGLAIKRSVYYEVGALDDEFKMYFEDIDLCWRVGLQGYRIGYAPGAIIHHMGQGSSSKTFFLWNRFRGRRNRIWSYFKNAGPLLLAVFIPTHLLICLASIAGNLLTFRFRKGLAEAAALAAALFNLRIALSKRGAIQKSRKVTDVDLVELGFIHLRVKYFGWLLDLIFRKRQTKHRRILNQLIYASIPESKSRRSNMSYREISQCRICGNKRLETILDLGMQALTGIFPRPGETVEESPVVLVKCHGEGACGLVQIKHSVSLEQMYGENYGYRSGLNRSMVDHLQALARYCSGLAPLSPGDLILDIGSNDGTLLRSYLNIQAEGENEPGTSPVPAEITLVGMDPTIKKFKQYYDKRVIPIPDFFSADTFLKRFLEPARKAKIVTSIACFYDLEDPIAFARDIKRVLHPAGVWVFEQSYSLLMLAKNMYDTAVQEHIEYYSLAQISHILREAGLSIREVDLNDCNGGSFRIVAEHDHGNPPHPSVTLLQKQEEILGLNELAIYRNFENSAKLHKLEFRKLLQDIKAKGQTVYGLGASTKFNAVLQFCEITPELLPKIGEVNPDKFGCTTPGSKIPIVSEKEILAMKPDYLVVGPYHFKPFLLKLPHVKKYLDEGGKLIFPLPSLEIVSK